MAVGLVTGERQGRSSIYALYDNHVAEHLDQALYHVEHLRMGVRAVPAELPEAVSADRVLRRLSGSLAVRSG